MRVRVVVRPDSLHVFSTDPAWMPILTLPTDHKLRARMGDDLEAIFDAALSAGGVLEIGERVKD